MQMPETIPLIFIREPIICIVCVYGILIMPAITISRRNFLIQDFSWTTDYGLKSYQRWGFYWTDHPAISFLAKRSVKWGITLSLYRWNPWFYRTSLERNDARWGSVEQQAKGLLVPVSRNLDSRSAAEGQLKVTCETEENGWMKTLRLCVNIQHPPV